MKNKIIYGIALIAFSIGGFAQVKALKIGDNPGSIDPSAALEIASTTKGLLPPRMTNNQMTTIVTPVDGLVVYCTDCSPVGLYLFSESNWKNLSVDVTDATTTVKGKIQLAGDLTGTANLPIIANNAITTPKIAPKAVTVAKLDAGTGTANKVLLGNENGDASWVNAPFASITTVVGASNVEIRGNGDWNEQSYESPYFTSTATLTKGLYMYVNSNNVFHYVRTNMDGGNEATSVSVELNVESGTATSNGGLAIVDAGTYSYALAGQVMLFNVTSATATIKFRYRPRIADTIQNSFKMGGAFGGKIYKIY